MILGLSSSTIPPIHRAIIDRLKQRYDIQEVIHSWKAYRPKIAIYFANNNLYIYLYDTYAVMPYPGIMPSGMEYYYSNPHFYRDLFEAIDQVMPA